MATCDFVDTGGYDPGYRSLFDPEAVSMLLTQFVIQNATPRDKPYMLMFANPYGCYATAKYPTAASVGPPTVFHHRPYCQFRHAPLASVGLLLKQERKTYAPFEVFAC